MYKPLYRLPTEPRTVTDDQNLWAREWNALADKIAECFPGYRVSGMDPGVTLFANEGEGSVSLSLSACLALLSVKEAAGQKNVITVTDEEFDSLKKVLRQVYLSDFGSRIVDDARRILGRLK